MAEPRAWVASINRSPGGVPKLGVPSARVTAAGLEGDGQRDLRHHGGPDRALVLFSLERIEALRAEGHPIGSGTTGENVTVAGLDWDLVTPGRRLALADVEVEVTSYAAPCEIIARSFSDRRSSRISQKVHPGWSRVCARVVKGGTLAVGDAVTVISLGTART